MRANTQRHRRPALLVCVLLGAACGESRTGGDTAADERVASLSAPPEATSLLGGALHAPALDSATHDRMLAQLDSAEAMHEASPDDPDGLIWVGRRLGYLGRYRDAIEVFSEGMERFPDDARFYRHRGHRYITVRRLADAETDLERAADLTADRPDVVEPDGQPNEAGIPRSTLQTNIWYHLGLARYLQHDFDGAAEAYRRGLELSPNDDMRVAMADWLWLSLMRLGRSDAADEVLASIRPEMEIMENDAYHRRLLLYKGVLPLDSVMPASASGDPEPLALATYGYGIGAWHLVNGDPVRARDLFRRVVDTGYWPAFGYLAAEAELAAMDSVPAAGAAPSTRGLN